MRNFFYMKLDSRADLRIEKPGNEMKEKVIRIDEVDDFCLQKKNTQYISCREPRQISHETWSLLTIFHRANRRLVDTIRANTFRRFDRSDERLKISNWR